MAYSLRSRRDLASHLEEVCTDTSVTGLTDPQIMAKSPQAVPTRLEPQQYLTILTTLTNPTFSTPELLLIASSKPETEFADGPNSSAEGKGGMVSSPPGREVLANTDATSSCMVVGKYWD